MWWNKRCGGFIVPCQYTKTFIIMNAVNQYNRRDLSDRCLILPSATHEPQRLTAQTQEHHIHVKDLTRIRPHWRLQCPLRTPSLWRWGHPTDCWMKGRSQNWMDLQKLVSHRRKEDCQTRGRCRNLLRNTRDVSQSSTSAPNRRRTAESRCGAQWARSEITADWWCELLIELM